MCDQQALVRQRSSPDMLSCQGATNYLVAFEFTPDKLYLSLIAMSFFPSLQCFGGARPRRASATIMKSQLFSVIISVFITLIIVQKLPRHTAILYPKFQETRIAATSSQRVVSSPNISVQVTQRDNLYDVQNETLGFQEIHVISLPHRGDKQDSFAIQAAYSGIKYKLADGVDGRLVPKESLPFAMKQDDVTIGCLRAHLNVYQDMIKRNLSSVLIFEDDADWDVALKSQLVQFARGARYLSGAQTSNDTSPNSPYGDDWDLLWFGHNAADDKSPFIRREGDNRRFVISKDPTVLPPRNRTETPHPDMSYWETGPDGDTSTRIVLVPTWGINAAAYALSQRGARKLLYLMSLSPFNYPMDQAMGYYCKFKIMDIKCVSPFPAIIGVSKPAGGTDRWSDMGHIQDGLSNHVDPNRGFSLRVRFSLRQNLDRLMEGKRVFRDAYGTEMHIDDISAAVGHPEVLELHAPKRRVRPMRNP